MAAALASTGEGIAARAAALPLFERASLTAPSRALCLALALLALAAVTVAQERQPSATTSSTTSATTPTAPSATNRAQAQAPARTQATTSATEAATAAAPPAVGGAQAAEPGALVVEGESARDVFGVGRTVVVRGVVRRGVMAFGGDVIVEGRVEGDVAALGGSVIQREGSWIGGDVWVFGGTYHHGKSAPGRNPASATVMYAGYEQELRQIARDPASLLAPDWSARTLGLHVLSVLAWFIVSLALTAAAPGPVSRAAARLQLTSLRVALIGLVAAVVLFFGVPVALHLLPPVVGAFVGALAFLFFVVAYLFGRVAINAATGRWLQRVLPCCGGRSESAALLLGATFWAFVLSLPYVWALAVAGLVTTSLGLALTARYRLGWRK